MTTLYSAKLSDLAKPVKTVQKRSKKQITYPETPLTPESSTPPNSPITPKKRASRAKGKVMDEQTSSDPVSAPAPVMDDKVLVKQERAAKAREASKRKREEKEALENKLQELEGELKKKEEALEEKKKARAEERKR